MPTTQRFWNIDRSGRKSTGLIEYSNLGSAVYVKLSQRKKGDVYRNTSRHRIQNILMSPHRLQDYYQVHSKSDITVASSNISVFNDNSGNEVYFRENEIIIGFTRVSARLVAEIALRFKLTLVWFDRLGNFGLFRIHGSDLAITLGALGNDLNIKFAEPNVLDGYELPESDLEDEGVDIPKQLPWNQVLLRRHAASRGDDGKGVIIAVVDTPIHLGHRGIKDSLYIASHELHFGTSDPISQRHGTAVASIIGDREVVEHGVSLGICPAARILPISIDDSSGSSYARRATAINYLAKSYIDRKFHTKTGGSLPLPRLVVNCSWKVSGTQDLTAIALAFGSLVKSGAICVCSAGNDSAEVAHYPSDYPGVISVAGMTKNLLKSKGSNFGKNISFAMPGGDGTPYDEADILAALEAENYSYFSGTSFAAPHASGMFAAIWSRHPMLNGLEVIKLAKDKYCVRLDREGALVGKMGFGSLIFPT